MSPAGPQVTGGGTQPCCPQHCPLVHTSGGGHCPPEPQPGGGVGVGVVHTPLTQLCPGAHSPQLGMPPPAPPPSPLPPTLPLGVAVKSPVRPQPATNATMASASEMRMTIGYFDFVCGVSSSMNLWISSSSASDCSTIGFCSAVAACWRAASLSPFLRSSCASAQ